MTKSSKGRDNRNRRKGQRGVPRAVEKRRAGKPVVELDMGAAQQTWLLDVLAWINESRVAPRIDTRGQRAALPPVILPSNAGSDVVAYETADAIRRLKSRHRAFSQIAGRYSPLVIGARDAGVGLRIVIYDLLNDEPDEGLDRISSQLADYLEGTVTLHGAATARTQAAGFQGEIPESVRSRNPVAWALGGFAAPAQDDHDEEDEDEEHHVDNSE